MNKEDKTSYTKWLKRVHAAIEDRKSYIDRCKKIERKYRSDDLGGKTSSFNILFSNTETITPILYSDTPRAESRIRGQVKSPQARDAAQILEDAVNVSIDSYDFDAVMTSVLKDYQLAASGVARVNYVPVFDKVKEEIRVQGVDEVPKDGEELAEQSGVAVIVTPEHEQVLYEEVRCDHVYYEDLLYPMVKRWDDVPWVAFKGLMSREELVDSFGSEIGEKISLNKVANDEGRKETSVDDDFKRALVWEIWDKENKQKFYIADGGYVELFDLEDDPLRLRGFFPIPEPLFGIQTNSTIEPIPEYVFYQDQANELNEVTNRITKLTKELKRRGVYDDSIKGLSKVISASDNTFQPVKEWAHLVEKGGINNVISEVDITAIANVLVSLYNQRTQILQIIYQIIGLGDIQRATTDPRETLGAQKLKGHYGTLRISTRQRRVAKFVKQLIELKAEIIAEHFAPETLAMMASVEPKTVTIQDPMTGQPRDIEISPVEYVANTIKPLIEDQEPRQLVIDIESDSTIAIDEEADQKAATEFTGALTNFAQVTPLLNEVYGVDVSMGLLVELMKRFKLSRRLQEQFLDRLAEIKKQEENPEPEQPSPEQMKMQLEVQKLQLDAEKFQIQSALKAKELELKEIELGLKTEIESTQMQFDMAQAISEFELDVEKLALESVNPNKNIVAES